MKTSRKTIESFLEPRKMAIAGVSRDPKKFGNVAFTGLKEKGFDLYPIHPSASGINGTICYKDITSLSPGIKNLLILTSRRNTFGIVKEAVDSGITSIWIQQMSETKEAIDYANSKGVNLVTGQCILMWTDPVKGFHKFHKNVKKFFGALPK
ncbi:MAG: CoA-binding protein [Bacteroidetes bacterium]|nr:CoA-binding protein [Bacteroidota bacterium]